METIHTMFATDTSRAANPNSTRLLLLASLLSLSCCQPKAMEREDCSSTRDCMDGMLCINERCRSACNSNSDCDDGLFCITGFCLPEPRSRTDAAVGDSGGNDVGAADIAGLDLRRSDAARVDVTAVDQTRPDQNRPDTAVSDSASPDLCVPFCEGRCAGAADDCGGTCPLDDCAGQCCSTICCAAGRVCDSAGACCLPQTCGQLGYSCGLHDNGCGGDVNCGGCSGSDVCQLGQCTTPAVDCSGIAANSAYELCDSGADFCAGVYTNSAGCAAYCAAAGLSCSERYGGEPGCLLELNNPWGCDDDNGHASDWCVCRRS